jgi:hypothetical protein
MRRLAVTVALLAALALPSAALAGGPTLPPGMYTAKVRTPAQLKGTWVLDFLRTGRYVITDNGTVVVRGHFSSTSMLDLHGETGPLACADRGVYRWKRAGKKLTLTKVSDPCAGRSAVLALPFTAV